MTALHVALKGKGVGGVMKEAGSEFVRRLVEAGADVNARDRNGNTPLHVASMQRFEAEKELLVKAGADQGAVNNQGLTPEGAAVRKKPWGKLLQVLEEAGET